MIQNSFPPKRIIVSILAGLLPLLIYLLVLIAPVPSSISRFFVYYSFLYFLIVLFLYYLSFRVKGKYDWLPGVCLTAFVFAIGLSYLWASGYSNDMIIGGLLPFKDGFSYYFGARLLSAGQALGRSSVQAAWRPLYPGFVSSLLLISRYNLQTVLAVQLGFLALCSYLSAYVLRRSLGALAAALYMTLIYFYIQSMVGFLYTELLGLTIGCLGLILLWNAARTQKMVQLVLGLVMLMIAVSVRAGTFFIFPMLALWAGWVFRKDKLFSFGTFSIALFTVVITFLVANFLYNSLVVEPGIEGNGNFAFTIYGQVVGGAGYNLAIQRFGGSNPEKVYRAAWRFFQQHPLSFLIGTGKAYRDFLLKGIYDYYVSTGRKWWDTILSVACLLATAWGLVKAVRRITSPTYSLVVAAFAGFFLSIPFLPPRDGGIRFYASTVPFFFLLAPIAFERVGTHADGQDQSGYRTGQITVGLSIILFLLTVVFPVLIQHFNAGTSPVDIQNCPANQTLFKVQLDAGSFLDLMPDTATSCGRAPEVCMYDFENSSVIMDLSDSLVHKQLTGPVEASGKSMRVFPAVNLVDNEPGLFIGESAQLQSLPNNSVIAGCATEVVIAKRPKIYQIESFYQP